MGNPVNAIGSVTSEGQPQSGQEHRSSGNFSIQDAPPGTRQVQWVITQNNDYASITFDVMQDKSVGKDPTIWSGLRNKSITDYQSARSFYIANPQGTGGSNFLVQVWPVS